MITKEALEFLSQRFNSGVFTGDTMEAGEAVALPEGVRMFSLEDYHQQRNRFRGAFTTTRIDAFAGYCTEHADGGAITCFIDPIAMKACATFNLGSTAAPGHGDHTATLTMKKTAAYEALLRATATEHKQLAFTDWCEDWMSAVSFYDNNDELIAFPLAIRAIREMVIESKGSKESDVGQMNTSISAMEAIEARSKHVMPAKFYFDFTPYEQLPDKDVAVRIGVRTGGDAPIIVPRIIGKEVMEEEIVRAFQDKLEDAFPGTSIRTLVGTFAIGA